MKTISYIFSFLAVLLLGFTSCSSENELVTQSENQSANQNCTVRFYLNKRVTSTRVENTGTEVNSETENTSANNVFSTEALVREKAISSLYALAFRKEGDVFYKMIKVELPTESQSYTFNMQQSGDYKFVLLANPAENLVNELTAKTAEFTLTDFPSVLVTQEPGEKVGEESGLTHFLMTSEVKTNVSVTANTTLDLGAIELTRLAARYDFYNHVEGFEMTSIAFTRRPAQSYMVKPMSQNGLSFTSDKEYTSANGLNAFTSIGEIYSYEDITSNDCAFTLKGQYKGISITKLIKLEKIAIQRNHLYNIIITENKEAVDPSPDDPKVTDDKLTFDIRVADWTTGEEISFTGDDLVNKEAPTFEASGSGVVTTDATESTPAVVRVPKEATTVTITAISASSADSQLTFVGELPAGWSIAEQIPTDINAKDGHLTHQFTIEMTENTADNCKGCIFKLSNIFEPTANVTFTLAQDGILMINNPLKYVAEYNLLSPGVFATEQSIERNKNGYFTREQVKSRTLAPAGYHIAAVDEFVSIITKSNVFADASNHAEANAIIHGKIIFDATYDSKKVGYNLAYVLRFKDSDGQSSENTCAFRYEFEQITGLTITCRALGSSFSGDINTISNESYWTDHAENNIIRFFPSCGRLNNGLLENDGKRASSWTCSISRSFSYYFFGGFGSSYISSMGLPYVALPVRVFRD